MPRKDSGTGGRGPGTGRYAFGTYTFGLNQKGWEYFNFGSPDEQATIGVDVRRSFSQAASVPVHSKHFTRKKVLEVTGIANHPLTQDGSVKQVEFVWQWDLAMFPEEIRSLIPNKTQSHTANFQLFDDGWRIR